jgi:N-acetylglucosaminyldiphosphoundecaprenol N-acetyl-beta-D-mannosaminyltransferase
MSWQNTGIPVGRVSVLGIGIDNLTKADAIACLVKWAREATYSCRYVVTPNVHHVVRFQKDEYFRTSYANAAMVIVDGKPVLGVSRLLGVALCEVVPGPDLCSALFDAFEGGPSPRIFLLGAAEGVAEIAAISIVARWPWVEVCGTYSPPMSFGSETASSDIAIGRINACRPDLLVIGLGAPKQEIWINQVSGRLQVKVALCLGAVIDYLSGKKRRAPLWMRKLCLEWLYRVLCEPRRLAGRYLHDACIFPQIVLRELFRF